MNRRLSWLLTAPLLVTGSLVGHSLGYRWAVSDPEARAHLLADSGHSYFAYVPLVLAVALTLLVAALAVRIRAAARGSREATSPPWLFALLPLVAFATQEVLERFLHSGRLDVSAVAQPAVLIGLALQLPLAVIALGLAWLLGEAADAIGAAFSEPPAVAFPVAAAWAAAPATPVRRSVATGGWSPRGPPPDSF